MRSPCLKKFGLAEVAPRRGKTMIILRGNRRGWLDSKLVSLMSARRSNRQKTAMSDVSALHASKREFLHPASSQRVRAGTEAESLIASLLQAKGEVPYTEVVEGLTEFLYERERAARAAIVDIGPWGNALFVSDTCRELELGRGKFRELDVAGRKPDELLSNLSRHGKAALPGDRRGSGGGAQDRQSAGSRRGGDGA